MNCNDRRRVAAASLSLLLCVAAASRAAAATDATPVLADEAARLRTVAAELGAGGVAPADAPDRGAAELVRTRAALQRAAIAPEATHGYMDDARRRLRRARSVGQTQAVLRDVARRVEVLAGLGRDGGAAAVGAARSFAAVRDALARELADPVYVEAEASYLGELLQRLTTYIADLIERVLRGDVLDTLSRASYYFMFMLLAIALGVLAWLSFTRYRQAAEPGGEGDGAVVSTRRMAEPGVYRAEARAHAAAGRFREAVRALFLMTLAELEALELVQFDRTRTNAEYLRQLARRTGPGPLRTDFGHVTRTYNRTWYGKLPCDGEEYGAFEARVQQVVRLAKGAAA